MNQRCAGMWPRSASARPEMVSLARGSRISLQRYCPWCLAPRPPPRLPGAAAGEQGVAGLTARKVKAPPARPGGDGPARLTCGQRAPSVLTHFPFRSRRKQSPPPRCIGPAAEGGLSLSFARGRVSRDRTAVKRLAQPVNPESKFLLVLARVVKKDSRMTIGQVCGSIAMSVASSFVARVGTPLGDLIG